MEPVIETMKEAYPELEANRPFIEHVIREEEIAFSKTWERGIDHFNKIAERIISNHGNKESPLIVSGEDAFTLYDTFGFPVDLTRILAEDRGMQIDLNQYNVLMESAKSKSR